MNTIQERIKFARESAGLKKADLVRAVGVSAPTISDWESGKIKNIEGENLRKLANALKVNSDWLLTGKGPRNRVDSQALPVDISALLNVATPTYMDTLLQIQRAQDAGVLEESDKAMLKIIANKYKDRFK
jgi:transcriptional regulator with XRE-family HTH domain